MNEEQMKKNVTIIIDGSPYEVPKDKIAFEQIVNLAFDNNPPQGPNVVITVKYSKGEGGKDGSLLPGQNVEVKEGMVFNVQATDRS